MIRYLLAAASAFVFVLPGAMAQLSGDGGPIRVNADTSEVLEKQRKVVLIKDVDIMQGDARLRANRVTINYSAGEEAAAGAMGGFGDIQTLVAEGEVFYVTPDLKATGQRGVYDAQSDTITLTGDVVLVRGEDVATGSRLVMRLAEGRTILDGGEGRVQFNITPSGTQTGGQPSEN